MVTTNERRIVKAKMQVRSTSAGNTASGYAIRFNSLSEDLGGFKEKIASTALDRTLRDGHNIFCFFGHDSNNILGSTESGTLKLSADTKGLRFDCQLPATTLGADTKELLRSNLLNRCSFGFTLAANGDKWNEDSSGQLIRTVTDLDLWEVSLVAQPAYESTSVGLRNIAVKPPLEVIPNRIPSTDELWGMWFAAKRRITL